MATTEQSYLDLVSDVGTSLVAQMVEHLPTVRETWVQSLGQEDLLEKEMEPTPVFLPGKSHGWRNLAGYTPWGCKEPIGVRPRFPLFLSIFFYPPRKKILLN